MAILEVRHCHGHPCELSPGTVLHLPYAEALHVIEEDFRCGVCGAHAMPLLEECEATEDLVTYLEEVLTSTGKNVKDWRCIMKKRIGISYKTQRSGLVWLDDKVKQVEVVQTQLGSLRHLPLLATDGSMALVAKQQMAHNQSFVVKPRHGSNSKHVTLWRPGEATEEAVLQSIEEAMCAEDKSWQKESWNQNAVPKGAVLQPLYALMSDFLQMDPEMPKLKKPLELKVQVLFGEVVGACLNTHPMFLWVTRDGAVIQWDPATPGLLKKGHGLWEDLPGAILQLLLRCLAEHWHSLRRDSEQLAVGLDELRVDWLLGDDFWGPRIGELTYMGTMAVDVAPISWRLARAFAAGHLGRCKKQALEPFG